MFGALRLRPWRTVFIFCFCFSVACLCVGQTAVAQSSQSGTITGSVHNGTTNQPAPAGIQVTLHAYNSSYTATETLTTVLDADGRFQFTLTDKPSDWVYMVSTDYQELSFSSTIAPLSGPEPLNLPLTIYDTTSDPANVVIHQLNIALAMYGESVQITELYSFANSGTAVFRNQAAGLQINLPSAAQSPTFERGLGPNSGYFPANEVVQQDGRWLDTAPLRPGPNSLTLRVSYSLPRSQLDLSRSLPYATNSIFVAVPDGLAFASEEWQQEATQSAGERGALQQFSQANLPQNSNLALTFQPEAVGSSNVTSPASYPLSDGLLSMIVLLLVTSVAFRLLRPVPGQTAVPQLATPTASPHPTDNPANSAERWQLLFALADLDAAYKNGKLSEQEYQQRRQEIKTRLRNIWERI